MPRSTSAARTASARCCDKAWLRLALPRLSVWPSIRARRPGDAPRKAAASSSRVAAAAVVLGVVGLPGADDRRRHAGDAGRHADAHADRHPVANTDGHRNLHPHTDVYPIADGYQHANADPHADADPHTDLNLYAVADPNTDLNLYAIADPNTDLNLYAIADPFAYADTDDRRDADAVTGYAVLRAADGHRRDVRLRLRHRRAAAA